MLNDNQYIKRNILTDNEKRFYTYLKEYCENNNYKIITKIRLADLIEANPQHNENFTLFAKIKSKHIDFAICNSNNLQPLLLIEIDDNTHNRTDRIERDIFVDKALREAGYKIIHIRTISQLENNIDYLLNNENQPKSPKNIITNKLKSYKVTLQQSIYNKISNYRLRTIIAILSFFMAIYFFDNKEIQIILTGISISTAGILAVIKYKNIIKDTITGFLFSIGTLLIAFSSLEKEFAILILLFALVFIINGIMPLIFKEIITETNKKDL